MNNSKYILSILSLAFLMLISACGNDDDGGEVAMAPEANAGADQTVDLEKTVILDASASTGEILTYDWTVLGPDGGTVTINNAMTAQASFLASIPGTYTATLTITNAGGSSISTTAITVENPTYATADQMGRPAINTVFNFFGNAEAKNGYNMTTPEGGNANPADFEGILDVLQEYIGLSSDTYTNVLGLDNTTTATVLATDVLMSNKDFPTTYGPSDLNNISVGENVLNGRGLSNDVVDVTLILAFAGDDLGSLNATQMGLISDNVQENDKAFSSTFPYLASPH